MFVCLKAAFYGFLILATYYLLVLGSVATAVGHLVHLADVLLLYYTLQHTAALILHLLHVSSMVQFASYHTRRELASTLRDLLLQRSTSRRRRRRKVQGSDAGANLAFRISTLNAFHRHHTAELVEITLADRHILSTLFLIVFLSNFSLNLYLVSELVLATSPPLPPLPPVDFAVKSATAGLQLLFFTGHCAGMIRQTNQLFAVHWLLHRVILTVGGWSQRFINKNITY